MFELGWQIGGLVGFWINVRIAIVERGEGC